MVCSDDSGQKLPRASSFASGVCCSSNVFGVGVADIISVGVVVLLNVAAVAEDENPRWPMSVLMLLLLLMLILLLLLVRVVVSGSFFLRQT